MSAPDPPVRADKPARAPRPGAGGVMARVVRLASVVTPFRSRLLILLLAAVVLHAVRSPVEARQRPDRPPAGSADAPAGGARPDGPGAQARSEADKLDWWERMLKRIEWLQAHGIHPEAGVVIAGSSLSFGASYRQPSIAGSGWGAEAGAMWSLRGYAEYELRAGLVEHARRTTMLRPADARVYAQFNDQDDTEPGFAAYLDVRRRDYPRVNFYGVGPGVSIDDQSDFALSGNTIDVAVQWQRDERVGVAARAGVLDFDIGRGTNADLPDLQDAFDTSQIPGARRQPRFVTAGAAVVIDRRDTVAVPSSGTFTGLSVWRFASLDDERHDFTRVTLDARHFTAPLDEGGGVLASRLLLSTDLTGRGNATPFYLQHHLGGSETLRGYPSYLLRGGALAEVSVEYRWRAHRLVEIAPFVDAGVVGPGFGALALSNAKVTPGIGFRVRTDERVLFRMDVGYRPGAARFSFGLSPVF